MNSLSPLTGVITAQDQGIARGICSICSTNPFVLEAGFAHARANNLPLLIESTCNQVNQYGGYTGQTPAQFMTLLHHLAARHKFPLERLVVGGDHVGPNPWRHEPASQAMDKSRVLVRDYVYAGYTKIHLDTSMKCADDNPLPLSTEVIAARAADLAQVAEESFARVTEQGMAPLYVIGTEVPAPGGTEDKEKGVPAVTSPEAAEKTISAARKAFFKSGLQAAWERVIAVVVQPGVEYGNESLYDYDAAAAEPLSRFIRGIEGLVFEAHSTDYQRRQSLHELVRDQFAILKVGPALTFALRETVFALAEIEQRLLAGRSAVSISNVREVIDDAMLADPRYWLPYYPGDARQQKYARQFSLSDRIRYYWPVPEVKEALQTLLVNLSAAPLPLPLLSQFLPVHFQAVRESRLANDPRAMIQHSITALLNEYAIACGRL